MEMHLDRVSTPLGLLSEGLSVHGQSLLLEYPVVRELGMSAFLWSTCVCHFQQLLCDCGSSGVQNRALTAQGEMLPLTEPRFSHLERGTNRLTLHELSKAEPTGKDSVTPGTGEAQGG